MSKTTAPASAKFVRRRVQKHFTLPTRTKSEFKDECDINRILKRHQDTGIVEHLARGQPRFADVSEVPQYFDAQLIVVHANQLFSELPSRIRKRFDNDPGAFLDFVRDPANIEEARSLGILPPLQTSEPATPAEGASAPPGGPQGAPDAAGGGGNPSTKKPPQGG